MQIAKPCVVTSLRLPPGEALQRIYIIKNMFIISFFMDTAMKIRDQKYVCFYTRHTCLVSRILQVSIEAV